MNYPDHHEYDATPDVPTLKLVPLADPKKRAEFERMYKDFSPYTFPADVSQLRSLNNPVAATIILAFLNGTSAERALHTIRTELMHRPGASPNLPLAPELLKKVDLTFVTLWKQTAERASNPDIMQ